MKVLEKSKERIYFGPILKHFFDVIYFKSSLITLNFCLECLSLSDISSPYCCLWVSPAGQLRVEHLKGALIE
jgi:hypothetical protein